MSADANPEPSSRRPLASRRSRLAQRAVAGLLTTPVTPNQISLASIAVSLGGAAALASGPRWPVMLLVAAACVQLRLACNLLDGVPVARRVRLRAENREPVLHDVLTWLDPTVPDDRLLGAALDVQARQPSAVVVLVTGDLNLQTKAAAVDLNRPGSDGGSGYWFPTPAGSACWAA